MKRLPVMASQRGFSLVELMVALTLSLVLMAGALSILYSSKVANAENDRLAQLQEAGRTVVEMLLRDARAAGYPGCSRPVRGDEFVNGLKNSTTLLWNFASPVEGYQASGSSFVPGVGSPAMDTTLIPSATTGSDVLVLRTTRNNLPTFRLTSAVGNVTADLQVTRAAGTSVAAGTPMIITSCEGSATFMATAFTPGSATAATIAHAAAGSATSGNLTADLARGGFGLSALVMPVQTVVYYVRTSASPGVGPALWQVVGNGTPQELVQGVENIQVQYGVDTDNDLLANEYRVASAVTDWTQVISLTFSVLIRSPDQTGIELDKRTYKLLEQTINPFNDRRQRAVFTTTVVLRNRTS